SASAAGRASATGAGALLGAGFGAATGGVSTARAGSGERAGAGRASVLTAALAGSGFVAGSGGSSHSSPASRAPGSVPFVFFEPPLSPGIPPEGALAPGTASAPTLSRDSPARPAAATWKTWPQPGHEKLEIGGADGAPLSRTVITCRGSSAGIRAISGISGQLTRGIVSA